MSFVQVGGQGWSNGPNPFKSVMQKLSERQGYRQQMMLENHTHANRMQEHAYLHQSAQERIYTQGSVDKDMATHKANLDRETFATNAGHTSSMSAQESQQRMQETTHAAETLSRFSGGRLANRVTFPGGASAEFPKPESKPAANKTTAKKTTAKKTTATRATPAQKPARAKTAAKTPAKPAQ